MSMNQPLISLALPIKNGLPTLKRAIEALQRQTYRNFELVVQDAGSMDGSLEYLRTIDLPHIDIVSQPDTGHGQAFNRAWARCRGTLACMLACDEFLEDNALEAYVKWHYEHPNAAYCYGRSRLWKNETEVHSIVRSGPFDFLKLLIGEYCPPAGAGVYNREVIASDFFYDENLKTCPDFDFFIRLGLRFGRLEIIEKEAVVFNSIRDRSFTTFRPESYDQIAQDKLYILDRFFVTQGNSRLNQHLRKLCYSGMYCWLSALLWEISGETPQLYKYIIEAAKYNPGSSKVAHLVAQTRGLVIDPETGQVLPPKTIQPEYPPDSAATLNGVVDILTAHTEEVWGAAKTERHGSGVRVVTDTAPWSYAAMIPIRGKTDFKSGGWYWLEILLEVQAGQIGLAVATRARELKGERLVSAGSSKVRLIFPLDTSDAALMVRNGSMAEQSVVDLFDARVYGMAISDVAAHP
jgi:glycosyltransferase involved in cell wall biosynthesis